MRQITLYLHCWTDVGANDHSDRLSPSPHTCGLDGYSAVEEIVVDVPDCLTTQGDRIYYHDTECKALIGKGQVQFFDLYRRGRGDYYRLGSSVILSRQPIGATNGQI